MSRTRTLLTILLSTLVASGVAQGDDIECGGSSRYGYIGIFEGGVEEQAITGSSQEAGMRWEDFVWLWRERADEGLHLTDIESYQGDDGETRYTGVFREGNGHVLVVRQPWSEFYALKQQYEAEGLRLIDVETVGGGYGLSYTRYFHGVFHPVADDVELHINLSWDSLAALREQKAREGMRLVDVEFYVDRGERLFLGLFRSGHGGHGLWMSNWWDFMKTWNEWTAVGLHLIDIEWFREGGEILYVGVYGPNPNGRVLIAGWSWEEFQQHRRGYIDLGYVLTDLEVQRCSPPVPAFLERGKERFRATALERVVGDPLPAHVLGVAPVAKSLEEPVFLRGDASGDGAIQMNDALTVLGALFQGAGKIGCEDAADANDDGELDVSDALGILVHLYGGGKAPIGIATFQADRTPDALSCGIQGDARYQAEPTPAVLEARSNDAAPHHDEPLKPLVPVERGPARPAPSPGLLSPLGG